MTTLSRSAVDALLARARRDVDDGLLPACQLAWADPASGLSFCYLTSARDLDLLRENRRTTAVSSLAAVSAA